jgi:hypothetical protein
MKIIIFVILVAVAAALYHYKPWKNSSSEASTSPTATEADPSKFINACSENAPEDIDQPETFCRCMWNEGVRNPNFMANIQGRSAVSKCIGAPGL